MKLWKGGEITQKESSGKNSNIYTGLLPNFEKGRQTITIRIKKNKKIEINLIYYVIEFFIKFEVIDV